MSGREDCALDVVAGLTAAGDEGCRQVPISVTWAYCRDDPYAVQMSFPAAQPVWVFGRDLLIAGIERAAGAGDVHLVTIGGPDTDVTVITIGCRWDEQAALTFATGDLIAFLALTNDVVPVGAESRLAQAELGAALRSRAPGTFHLGGQDGAAA